MVSVSSGKFVVAIIGFLVFFYPQTTKAQDLSVLLARMYVNEAGFDLRHWRDHAGMTTVLKRVGGGQVTKESICAYNKIVCRSERTDNRRWINELNAEGTKPEHWPSRLPWDDYVGKWFTLIKRAKIFMKQTPRACLDGIPYHWGAKGFREEFWTSKGWRQLRCPNTKNVFWAP